MDHRVPRAFRLERPDEVGSAVRRHAPAPAAHRNGHLALSRNGPVERVEAMQRAVRARGRRAREAVVRLSLRVGRWRMGRRGRARHVMRPVEGGARGARGGRCRPGVRGAFLDVCQYEITVAHTAWQICQDET